MKTDFIESCRKHLHPFFAAFDLQVIEEQPDCPEDDLTYKFESVTYSGIELTVVVCLSGCSKIKVTFVRQPLERNWDQQLSLAEFDSGFDLNSIRAEKGLSWTGQHLFAKSWDQPVREIRDAILESTSEVLGRDFSLWPVLKRRQCERQRHV